MKRIHGSPLKMIEEGNENENGDDEDSNIHSHGRRLSENDPADIDDDYRDEDDQRASKPNDRLSPDEHARATAAAVAHINGTSEYISFDPFPAFSLDIRAIFRRHTRANC